MNYSEAKFRADGILEELKPFCDRIEIAGSIRRECNVCHDITIVCIPKTITIQGTLFDHLEYRDPGFIEAVNRHEKVIGEPTGRYTLRRLSENILVDIFIADKSNWGLILTIRTGSVEFSKSLTAEWSRQGYQSSRGILYFGYEPFYIREEIDIFKLLGIPWIDPTRRNKPLNFHDNGGKS